MGKRESKPWKGGRLELRVGRWSPDAPGPAMRWMLCRECFSHCPGSKAFTSSFCSTCLPHCNHHHPVKMNSILSSLWLKIVHGICCLQHNNHTLSFPCLSFLTEASLSSPPPATLTYWPPGTISWFLNATSSRSCTFNHDVLLVWLVDRRRKISLCWIELYSWFIDNDRIIFKMFSLCFLCPPILSRFPTLSYSLLWEFFFSVEIICLFLDSIFFSHVLKMP